MMRPANLLPADLARDTGQRLPTPALAAIVAGTAVTGLLAVGYMSAHNQVTSRQSQLDAIHAQIAAIPRPKAVHRTIDPALGSQIDARQSALDQALASRISWDNVLRDLSLVLPDDVWLQTMSAKGGSSATDASATGSAAAAGNILTMTGYTYSQEGVARLLTRLSLVPELANVQLQSATTTAVSGRQVVGFTIGATVNSPSTGTGGGS